MIKFNSGEDESVTGIYTRATRLSPISTTKKDTVLKDYGIQTGWSKGQSDTAISSKAADAVLIKFKADQAKAKEEAKKAAEANNPQPAPAPITAPAAPTPAAPPIAAPRLSRIDAAAISRRYGIDPAKLFGWGVKNFAPNWLTSSAANYVWSSATSFEEWLKRAIRAGSVPR